MKSPSLFKFNPYFNTNCKKYFKCGCLNEPRLLFETANTFCIILHASERERVTFSIVRMVYDKTLIFVSFCFQERVNHSTDSYT